MLCGYYCPVRGRVCSLVFGVEAPRSVPELCFLSAMPGRRDWSTLTGRKATEYSFYVVVHLWVYSVVSLFTHCVGLQITLLLDLLSAPP